jgi:uncharacterized repeat protein (TIGR02543 family)
MNPSIKRAFFFGFIFLIATMTFVSIAGASSEKTMDLHRISAMQEPVAWTLTVNIVPSGGGSVTQTPPLPNAGKYLSGTVVTLSATPNSGFQFSGWSGEGLSGTGSVNITMDSDKVVTATFTTVACYTLTINKNPSGGGNVTPNIPPDCNGGTQYTSGSSVSLTASANSGFAFDSWNGCDSFAGTTCNVGMITTKTVTANFVACYTLTTNVNPSGTGSVTVNTAPNCGTQYKSGTSISLTAKPNSGYVFSSWSGASGGANTSVTISGNLTVTANFATVPPAQPTATNTSVPAPTSTTEAGAPVATLTPVLGGVVATPTLTPSTALPTTGSSPLTLVAIGLVLVLIVVGARYMRQSSA